MSFYGIRTLNFVRDGKTYSGAHVYRVNMLNQIIEHLFFVSVEGEGAVALAESTMRECYASHWQNIQFINTEVVARTILMRQIKERVRLKAQEEYDEGQMI